MATNIDPKTLFSTPNHCVTSFSLWNIRLNGCLIVRLQLRPWFGGACDDLSLLLSGFPSTFFYLSIFLSPLPVRVWRGRAVT
jgi:hypothetical protein